MSTECAIFQLAPLTSHDALKSPPVGHTSVITNGSQGLLTSLSVLENSKPIKIGRVSYVAITPVSLSPNDHAKHMEQVEKGNRTPQPLS